MILDNDYSILRDTWTIRDAKTEAKIAEINSRGAAVTFARNALPFGGVIPHRYEITIDDASNVPRESIVAAAMVIDAIQEN